MSDPTTRLRERMACAADYARAHIAETRSPCSRDLAWHIIQIAERTPDDALPREVKAVEALWRAAMEMERIEARDGD